MGIRGMTGSAKRALENIRNMGTRGSVNYKLKNLINNKIILHIYKTNYFQKLTHILQLHGSSKSRSPSSRPTIVIVAYALKDY